jgi:hypothetical protein
MMRRTRFPRSANVVRLAPAAHRRAAPIEGPAQLIVLAIERGQRKLKQEAEHRAARRQRHRVAWGKIQAILYPEMPPDDDDDPDGCDRMNIAAKIKANALKANGSAPKKYKRCAEFIPEAQLLCDVLAETCGRKSNRYIVGTYSALLKKLSRSLIEEDPRERITNVLRWYRSHHGRKFVPEFTSGKTFVEQFFRLEKAMVRLTD